MTDTEIHNEPKICDYCGTYMTEVNQKCPARHDGYCKESVLDG